ncbi:MAG: class I SAM-dependent methyltransferase [bacterium]|nr:class I SAM-dependent methyltransferase [bacterium]
MLLNRVEYALMNNPVRAAIQRRYEVPKLLRLGGAMRGGRALEVGCGRGVGTGLIHRTFGADSVDAFDLDPRMVTRARSRVAPLGSRVRLWLGDASAIAAPDATYDAVFDFGIIHHVPEWRRAVAEVHRVLKPNGRFYAEEVLEGFIGHPITRRLFEHPQVDRFDSTGFSRELQASGFELVATEELWGSVAWFVARKRANVEAFRPSQSE